MNSDSKMSELFQAVSYLVQNYNYLLQLPWLLYFMALSLRQCSKYYIIAHKPQYLFLDILYFSI